MLSRAEMSSRDSHDVAELEAHAGERRKQREIADAPVVGRSHARRVLARELIAVQARDVEEPAHAEQPAVGRLPLIVAS